MEQTQNYKVRYSGKLIRIVTAHSKWEAIDRVYNEFIGQYAWIERRLLTAVLNR